MAWQGAWEAFEAAGTFAQQALAATEVAEDMFDAASGVAKKISNELGDDPTRNIGSYLGKRKFTGDETNPSLRGPPPIHRRIEPVSNSPSSTSMSKPALKSSGRHQDEVAVMPHAGPISKIIEDYHTINLHYYERQNFTTTPVQNEFKDISYRLNSIYDVNETDIGSIGPMGRDTWASIYQYYRVLSSHIEIKIKNRSSVNTILAGLVLEEDELNLSPNPESFMMRKNAIRSIIPGYTFVDNALGVIRFSYNPNNWDHHVQQSGVEERWTPIGQAPANLHRGILRFIAADGSLASPSSVSAECFISVKYTVQFREANKTILTTGSLPS